MAIARIKSFIDTSLKNTTLNRTANLEPEIGIKIVHSPASKALYVTVIGARHLPQNFGFTRVNSYVVKVKLLPGKEKFETTPKNESWPNWNEEFTFPLSKETKSKFGKTKITEEEINGSKFIVATVYAVLEDKPLIATEKKDSENEKKKGESSKKGKNSQVTKGASSVQESSKNNSLLTQFFGKPGDKEKSGQQKTARERIFDKRRTLGAATVKLDPSSFVSKPVKPKNPSDVSTGEVWWPLKPISSGISGAEERRESKKGQVEISLCQEKSEKEDETGGNLVLSLIKLRCSLQTMHEHEALKGQLYIKMSVVDGGIVTHFWKSDRFSPTISISFPPDMARVVAKNPQGKDISFVVKFVSKNKIGKKTAIGHFVIGPDVEGSYGEQWKQALAKPGQQITKWQPFE
ncbi:uncharacterized protein LOC125500707 [Athalia rosae]|uniref:uncharacterized protein LOC125500707 n=1 Tax=Athalia rosae TaxID=37344 RepID=UPI000626DE29|nr:uncharacterized protein LOC125500707 [Athalia rosae]